MQKGFSLVELSIVLVILGLLTGGILAGKNLIRAAEIRSISTQYASYVAAAQTFRDKYFAIPGDMRNATDFWPTAINGNGNGQLSYHGSYNENYQFWVQLQLAGLVEGSLTGLPDANSASTPGENTPRAKLNQAGWDSWGLFNPAATPSGFPGACEMIWSDYGNVLSIGTRRAGWWNMSPAITPEEAWNVDTKMDDGLPAQGKVIAAELGATLCYNGSYAACNRLPTDVTDYDLDNTATICSLIFKQAF